MKLLEDPPYTPDLSPSDFLLFPRLKDKVSVQRFLNAVAVFENIDSLVLSS